MQNKVWCSFEDLDLKDCYFNGLSGVYFIFTTTRVVYIGCGSIREKIIEHREDPQITNFLPDLMVTWIKVSNKDRQLGILRFLLEEYEPRVPVPKPTRNPILVKLPSDYLRIR